MKPEYEYFVGYTATWASTFRMNKHDRLLHGPFGLLTEAITIRHSLENRERYQVYKEMIVRGPQE